MSNRFVLPLVALLALAACTDETPLVPAGGASASLGAAAGPQLLEVKFSEQLRVRGDGVSLSSEAGADLSGVEALLDRYGVTGVAPLFQAPAAQIDEMRQAAVRISGQAGPDLRSWYLLTVPAGVDADAVIAGLLAMPEVVHAYRAPVPAPPPGPIAFATPDFTSYQSYFGAAPLGTDAAWARSVPGASGDGVTIVDVEYDWHFEHEDLGLTPDVLIAGRRYTFFGRDHGTAVLGMLVGRDNGLGVTGGVPNATILVAGAVTTFGYLPALSIFQATVATVPGDVLLLEQQTTGPTGAYVPLEWIQSVFDATQGATLAGRIVVAAAGNGGQNLDSPTYLGRFDRAVRNSGAIIVGAGNTDRSRLYFSSYGSRVDLQGLGAWVATTGYGDLFGAAESEKYTSAFGGTSSASPIVTAAVAAIQGRRRMQGQPVLNAAQMVQLLRETGTPQRSIVTTEAIGPLPNVRAALAMNDGPTAPGALSAVAASGTVARLAWQPALGHTGYRVERRRRTGEAWGGWQPIGTPAAADSVFIDRGGVAGTVQVYQIRACGPARCSPWTQSAQLRMPVAPGHPAALLAAAASSSSIRLSWVDSIAHETRFVLERRVRPAGGDWGPWAQVIALDSNVTRHTDNRRTPGDTYLYGIRACNPAGCSGRLESAPVTLAFPPPAPAPVQAAALSSRRARVTWVDAGGETHFELARRGQNPDGGWSGWTPLADAPANAVSAADSELTSGRRYQYRARACSGAACSAWAASPALRMPAVPAVPAPLRAVSVRRSSVALAWTPAGANETSFTLQRRTRNPDFTFGPWVTLATLPRDAVRYADTAVASGTRYTYRIAACDGPACSGWTNGVGVTVP
jgi:serine protease